MEKETNKVACQLCIKAYKLNSELLGKNLDKCYWCNIIIINNQNENKK